MQFVFPGLLWALALLLIPIIIHLFYFRRFKKVYFSNVRFLKEIKQETSSRNKIKNLLILLMRLLAIASLIFAFAQPFLSSDKAVKSGTKGLTIYIDNSFSMSAEADDEPLLQRAKKKAIEIVEAYNETDKIQILTSDFEGKHQRFVSQEEARGLIDEIEKSPATRSLDRVIDRSKQAMKTEAFDNKYVYLISDFQKNIAKDIKNDTLLNINLIPLQAIKESNVSIDTVYLESGVAILNQANEMSIRLRNHGEEKAENIRLSLNLDGREKPVGSYDIEANASILIQANFTPSTRGWQKGSFKITDFPIVFDDEYFVSFYVNEEVKILSINQGGSNKYVDAAFKSLPYFKNTNTSVSNVRYDDFNSYDLILLNDINNISSGMNNEIKQYVESGGNVLIFPSEKGNRTSYNSLLATIKASNLGAFEKKDKEVKTINTNEFVFDGVFEKKQAANLRLPKTSGNYALNSVSTSPKVSLLKYKDGSEFLTKNKFGNGYVYLSAAPLNNGTNDLVNNAEVFVPMVYKMALSSASSGKLANTINRDRLLFTNEKKESAEENFTFEGPSVFIPGQFNRGKEMMLDVGEQIRVAGFYDLTLNNEVKETFAFNYDNRESLSDYYSIDELKTNYADDFTIFDNALQANFTSIISENAAGKSLWRYFLIACLVFLLIEQLLIKYLKN